MARVSTQQKFGKRIRTLRLEAGYTQEELGFKTGLDRTYISGIETGKRNPSLRNVGKLAKALKVETHELF
jgi:transcriptional regulator with XRE-family HTH domain